MTGEWTSIRKNTNWCWVVATAGAMFFGVVSGLNFFLQIRIGCAVLVDRLLRHEFH